MRVRGCLEILEKQNIRKKKRDIEDFGDTEEVQKLDNFMLSGKSGIFEKFGGTQKSQKKHNIRKKKHRTSENFEDTEGAQKLSKFKSDEIP